MAARATTLAQGFSQKLLLEMYDLSILDSIVNRDYQGEVNAIGSKLNILNFDRITERTYTGANLTTADDLTENNAILTISQYKSFYWREKTLDNWLSYIKDPHPTVVKQKAEERARNMELYAFALYAKVQAGNRDGTDITAGTVTIDASGNVTGTNGVFTSACVGRGFKATGHLKWYRVASYGGTDSIVIEDDLDDVTTQYTGGVLGGGAAYIISAVTPVSVTTGTLVARVAQLRQKLDKAETYGMNAVPDSDRWLIVPPEFENTVVRSTGVVLSVDAVYADLIQKGYIGSLLGFKIFKSNRLTGNNTSGYHCLAGHPNWMTFAEKLLSADIEEVLIGNFGSAYKDLFVYGAKVADRRRSFAAEGFWTFA
jgi:hypothetical protein